MRRYVPMLAVATLLLCGALLAGCASTPPATNATTVPTTGAAGQGTATPIPTATIGAPIIVITSPLSGTFVTPGDVTVTARVSNFSIVDKQGQANVAGEGHVHFYMDVSPVPSIPGQPAIPADPNAVWAHVSGTTYVFTNVTPGQHTLSVQLVNNDHTPVIPIVSDSVTVTATGAPAGGGAAATGTATTASTTAATTVGLTTTATTAMTTVAATSAATTTTAGGSATVALTAQNIKFDKNTITVPAGSTVTVTFNNMDSGVPHNFAVYTDSSASTAIFKGQIVTGPTTTTYTFTAPSTKGTFYFRCDVHPTTMNGQFVVQ